MKELFDPDSYAIAKVHGNRSTTDDLQCTFLKRLKVRRNLVDSSFHQGLQAALA
ncbi:MAG TPA: hypothetical protein VHR47_12400 [Bacillota bacterium]|nr:hypothetical protein [Bacillota bacterium]